MPVTNRSLVQLTPGETRSAIRDYFNALSPSLTTVETGLAIFALYIIVRFCLCRAGAWLRRIRGADRSIDTGLSVLLNRHHQQQQQHSYNSIWTMDEKADRGKAVKWQAGSYEEAFRENAPTAGQRLVIDSSWTGGPNVSAGEAMARQLMSRPPPAPPLTPPELSTAVFTFEDRPRGGIDDSFIHQPNPDYMSSATSTTTAISPPSSGSPTLPRRRSYNKTLPIGIPVPQPSSTESDPADLTFSPSSYPPTSPLLPPPPPNAQPQEIDVQGEIVGVLDGDGAGWTRHTRVYGGGVCLACAASGGNHGGGFYGATVRPEEMR